ncbi:GTP-binding protein [Leptobacterium flavescens]|uniref:GTP-binding protein n=1 Tax=Leptobacterium flavescens TaxID=472055 RepID=A0A6P0UQT8_9FLAO|nr:GTP-binding protein [Leptobacterium flavescens]NER14892.1 GTP-binding protein [Leptobacterium flavescens]
MKTLSNDIVLRPRFQLELSDPKENVLQAFEHTKGENYRLKRIDDHIFIKFGEEKAHFWSPQLQLEINESDGGGSRLYGLFGPNPSLWTFFMFLHFGLATLFVIFGIWAYSNWSLEQSYGIQVAAMIFMVIMWFTLYLFGRMGKAKGKPQMQELYSFMKEVLKNGNQS